MAATTKLTESERELLTFLAENAEYQYNTWAIPVGDLFCKGSDLQSLKRRGLVDAEGRGNSRQWWITTSGRAAIAEAS